jgi:predicted RNA binding protein YcfA (HicA-like mRNA interferase family)
MAKLPSVSSRKVVKAFRSFGWEVVRQESSHIIMVKEGERATLSVPDHRSVAKGTRRSLIRSAGLTVKEFVAAL